MVVSFGIFMYLWSPNPAYPGIILSQMTPCTPWNETTKKLMQDSRIIWDSPVGWAEKIWANGSWAIIYIINLMWLRKHVQRWLKKWGTSFTSSSVILPSSFLSTLWESKCVQKTRIKWNDGFALFVQVLPRMNIILRLNKLLMTLINCVHVEEDLKPRIEALIGNLGPELVKLVLADFVNLHSPSPAQRIEQLQSKLLRISHSFNNNKKNQRF